MVHVTVNITKCSLIISSISESENVDSANLSSLNISTDTTSSNKSKFEYNDNNLKIEHNNLIDFSWIMLNLINMNLTITVQIKIKMMKNVIAKNL